MRYLYYFLLATAIIGSVTALILLLVNDRFMFVPMIIASVAYLASRFTLKKLS